MTELDKKDKNDMKEITPEKQLMLDALIFVEDLQRSIAESAKLDPKFVCDGLLYLGYKIAMYLMELGVEKGKEYIQNECHLLFEDVEKMKKNI